MIPGFRASFALLCVLAYAPPVVPAPERSVSSSRQFLVYGSDVRLRGAICDLAEKTKRDLLKLIDQRDEWATPIVVNAQYPQANVPERPRAAFSLAQTGFGLKLQLDLTIAPEVSQPKVRRELLRALLLEMMYRRETNLPAGTAYVPPPDWLLDGIPPTQPEFERGRLIGVLRAPVTAGKILSLKEFLRPRKLAELDGPSRSLYRAYSFALVELLTHAPDGRGRLTRFIANFRFTSNDPMADLGSHFPELSTANRAEKMWSLHVARLATSQPFQLFSAAETEEKLDKLLSLRVSNAGQERNYQLDEFAKFIRTASSKAALTQCSRGLSILATCANPIYRPLICEYAKIAAILARGKIKGTAEGLARLHASRKSVATTMHKIDDYLNWFEASKSSGLSGAFADYMGAAELAAEPEQRRRDAMSVYLDVLEAQFQN
jgi:hypothetical protein